MKYLLIALPCLLIGCTLHPAAKQPTAYRLNAKVHAPQCGGGYNILNAPVTVRNEANTIIAATQTTLDNAGNENACIVQFSALVPREAFYQIHVGSHDAPSYSFDQLQGMKWSMELSLP